MAIAPNTAQAMIERARAHAARIDVPMSIAGAGLVLGRGTALGSRTGRPRCHRNYSDRPQVSELRRRHDDAVNFTHDTDIRANFAEIMNGQFDPQEMAGI